jgi:hypothetical protein
LHKGPASEAFKSVADNLVIEIIRRNAEQKPSQKVDINEHRR